MSEINVQQRTPEQEAAYMEARYVSDRQHQKTGRYMSEEQFGRLYLATLHRQLKEALEPIHRAKASYLAMFPQPTVVVGPDDMWKFVQAPPTDAVSMLDQMAAAITKQYTQGLRDEPTA